tara:strand:- start:42 stop:212 length:171 start_codon:yes stop_codon:yes gene_type:complete
MIYTYSYPNLPFIPQTKNFGLSFQILCGEYELRKALKTSYAPTYPPLPYPLLVNNE